MDKKILPFHQTLKRRNLIMREWEINNFLYNCSILDPCLEAFAVTLFTMAGIL
jgi:hypothetical protein